FGKKRRWLIAVSLAGSPPSPINHVGYIHYNHTVKSSTIPHKGRHRIGVMNNRPMRLFYRYP
ncbi:MAG: hypothetical protein ACC707_17165, partial [Thiohalomonadales bacterium]